jgi:hypothetical protein
LPGVFVHLWRMFHQIESGPDVRGGSTINFHQFPLCGSWPPLMIRMV